MLDGYMPNKWVFVGTGILLALYAAPKDEIKSDFADLNEVVKAASEDIIPYTKGYIFNCKPLGVYDGDGPIYCANGVKIRLAGIAAREINNECLDKHPCPTTSGIEARDYLAILLGNVKGITSKGYISITGQALKCISRGVDKYKRVTAFCHSPKYGDLSCAMLESGKVAKWQKYWNDHKCP